MSCLLSVNTEELNIIRAATWHPPTLTLSITLHIFMHFPYQNQHMRPASPQ